eukprot:gene23580-18820_t
MSLSLFSRLPHTAVRRPGLLRQHLVAATSRAASTDSAWAAKWSDATEVIHSDVTHHESGEQLRKLIGTGLLKFTDLRDDPEKFFHAHRVLARHAVDHGPGFWIRFTVQYNLFAGTIVAAGGDGQLDRLAEYQRDEQLGCFGLTEKLAVPDVGQFLYNNVHSLHHKSYITGPWSGLAMHPVEHLFYYSCT